MTSKDRRPPTDDRRKRVVNEGQSMGYEVRKACVPWSVVRRLWSPVGGQRSSVAPTDTARGSQAA